MAIQLVCDLCGKELAVATQRVPVHSAGRRLLVSVLFEVDEGEKAPKRVDICVACIKRSARDYVKGEESTNVTLATTTVQ